MKSHSLQVPRESYEGMMVFDFSDETWLNLIDRISRVFVLPADHIQKIEQNPVFKLIAALPYLAGCEEPQRTALSHMSVYMLASLNATKDAFAHNGQDNEDVFRRLERISHFHGGDPGVIDRGMKLLAISMLGDHLHDARDDAAIGKMNPLNAGHWDARSMLADLRESVTKNPCPPMDAILGLMPSGFWAG